MTQNELLPCPFCSHRAAYENGDDRQYGKYTRVYCCFCDASVTDTREKYAIQTWNTRAPRTITREEFGKVKEAISKATCVRDDNCCRADQAEAALATLGITVEGV